MVKTAENKQRHQFSHHSNASRRRLTPNYHNILHWITSSHIESPRFPQELHANFLKTDGKCHGNVPNFTSLTVGPEARCSAWVSRRPAGKHLFSWHRRSTPVGQTYVPMKPKNLPKLYSGKMPIYATKQSPACVSAPFPSWCSANNLHGLT